MGKLSPVLNPTLLISFNQNISPGELQPISVSFFTASMHSSWANTPTAPASTPSLMFNQWLPHTCLATRSPATKANLYNNDQVLHGFHTRSLS
ncbi:hypothetical protein DSO57_1022200 [Entomophthora muscae]|uniref:Uncharacterized protein n=1 Tax=Entomophthora muscae TaxID=34485 RepID=A0ACC2SG58_9FUNG|nr:hypothetical protein DSO57_1022200 [Entomophthora muscae]